MSLTPPALGPLGGGQSSLGNSLHFTGSLGWRTDAHRALGCFGPACEWSLGCQIQNVECLFLILARLQP